eukprot:jgi/Botrbrau1/12095/Bobra.0186s0018.1
MWAQVKTFGNNVQQLGQKARNTASQFVSEVLETAEELSNQAKQWEEEEEEESTVESSVSRPVPAAVKPTAATSRLDALKARLEADRRKASTLKVGNIDRSERSSAQQASSAVGRVYNGSTQAEAGHAADLGRSGLDNGTDPLVLPETRAWSARERETTCTSMQVEAVGGGERFADSTRRDPGVGLGEDDGPSWNSSHADGGGDLAQAQLEVQQLREQLARLKRQILQSTAAAEDEQASIRREAEAREAELHARIAAFRERLHAAEQLASTSAVVQEAAVFGAGSGATAAEAEALRQRAELAEQQLEEIRGQLSTLQIADESASHAAKRLPEVEAQLAAVQEQVRERDAQVRDLTFELQQTAEREVQLNGQLASIREELRGRDEEVQVLRREVADARQELQAAVSGASPITAAAVKRLQELLDEEREAHSAAKGEAQELTRRLQEAEEKAEGSILERDSFWKSQVEEREARIADLQQRLQEAEGAQREPLVDDRLEQLKTDVTRLSAMCEDLEARLDEEQQRSAAATSRAQRLEGEVQQAGIALGRQEEASSGACQHAAAQARLEADAEWQEQLAESLAGEEQLRQALQQELQVERQALAEVRFQVATLKASLETAEADQCQLEASLQHHVQAGKVAEREKAELEARAQQLEEEASRKTVELESTRRELQSLRDARLSSTAELASSSEALTVALARAAAAEEGLRTAEAARRDSQAQLDAQRLLVQRLEEEVARARQQGATAAEAAAGEQVSHLAQQLADQSAALEDALQEKERARLQLARLKQAMVAEQEDEEEKIRWRVDAEVRLVAESIKAEAEGKETSRLEEVTALRAAAAESAARCQQLDAVLSEWEAAVTARDEEIRNLQAALGELTYESEAAERMRSKLRAVEAGERAAREEAAIARAAEEQARAAARQAAQELEQLKHGDAGQQERERRLQEEAAMLRRALAESMKRINLLNSDSSAMVDRRIVVKLLVTFFERKQSREVLALMSRMLGFSDDEKRRVGLAGSKKGVLGTVAAMPLSLLGAGGGSVSGALSPAASASSETLADSWIDFLIQQAEAADDAEASLSQPPPSGTLRLTPNVGESRSVRPPAVSPNESSTPRTPIFGPPR